MVRGAGSCTFLLVSAAAAACFDPGQGPSTTTSETTTAECVTGEVRCSCFPNSTCNTGLACISQVCVDLGHDTTTSGTDGSASFDTGDAGVTSISGASDAPVENTATATDEDPTRDAADSSTTPSFASGSSDGSTSTGEGESTAGIEAPEHYLAGGPIAPLPGASPADGAGFALLVRNAAGTSGSVAVAGLSSDAAFPFYVHTGACEDDDGGEPYLIDPSLGLVESNVIGSTLETDANGAALTILPTIDHLARTEARSLVVLTQDGTRILCSDLWGSSPRDPFVVRGSAANFSRVDPFDARADLIRDLAAGQTSLQISATGMPATGEFHIHLRTRACGIDAGGPYYKLDHSRADGDQTNELWLTFLTDEAGASSAQVTYDHLARADAVSAEIHPSGGGFEACVDFSPM